ncbi:restriction endonuclease subunit S [Prevotella nigrescens]|uniref:restriction endonuclease subunit S n=1 Tax=Prevotella nigrescens TaxID=28133 RepID=UPI0028EDF720|nr:restriction endonuclease subunit S [Prevotella nigrescens]
MQHLFPILGENMPKLRFPKFKKSKGWKIVKLKTICHITNGKANTQDHHKNGKYPLFDRSAITKASDEYIFDAEAVIIPGEGVRFIPKYYNGKFNLHQRAYALKDFTCNALFVYYIMQQKESLLAQKAVQSTVLSLRLPILQEFPIELPTDIDEQKEIAECLASIDDLIDKTKQKLVMLQNHKRGLMQQLFPAV